MRKYILLAWLAFLGFSAYYLVSNNVHLQLNELPFFLKEKVHSLGGNGIATFLIVASLRPLLLLPTSLLVLFSGLTFGVSGIFYSLATEIIASIVAFFMSRYLGHRIIEEHTGQRFKNFEHKLETHSFKSIMLLRLMNFVPNDLISYAAGVSNMKLSNFLMGSTFGLIPTIVFYNYIALGVSDVQYLVLPAALLSLSIITGKTIRYEYKKHKENHLQIVAETVTI